MLLMTMVECIVVERRCAEEEEELQNEASVAMAMKRPTIAEVETLPQALPLRKF